MRPLLSFKERKKKGELSPLAQMIDRGAVGPHGSRSADPELLRAVLAPGSAARREESVARWTTFWTAFYFRGSTPEESDLLGEYGLEAGRLTRAESLFSFLEEFFAGRGEKFWSGPKNRQALLNLLNSRDSSLSFTEARELCRRFLAREFTDGEAAIFQIGARLKLETDAEYQGYLAAFQESLAPAFQCSREDFPADWQLIQISEPFDGRARGPLASMVVPELLAPMFPRARFIFTGTDPVAPKFGLTVGQVAAGLGWPRARDWRQAREILGEQNFVYLDLKDFAPAVAGLESWREETMKRSFPATLEKLILPLPVDAHVSPVFHRGYPAKMFSLLDFQGLKNYAVTRRGDEGGLSFRPDKPALTFLPPRKTGDPVRQFVCSVESPGAGPRTLAELTVLKRTGWEEPANSQLPAGSPWSAGDLSRRWAAEETAHLIRQWREEKTTTEDLMAFRGLAATTGAVFRHLMTQWWPGK